MDSDARWWWVGIINLDSIGGTSHVNFYDVRESGENKDMIKLSVVQTPKIALGKLYCSIKSRRRVFPGRMDAAPGRNVIMNESS